MNDLQVIDLVNERVTNDPRGCVCGRCEGEDYESDCCCAIAYLNDVFGIYAEAKRRNDDETANAAIRVVSIHMDADPNHLRVQANPRDAVWLRGFVREIRAVTDDWFTIRELSRLYGFTERHLRRLAESGTIVGYKGPGNYWLIDLDASSGYFEAHHRCKCGDHLCHRHKGGESS